MIYSKNFIRNTPCTQLSKNLHAALGLTVMSLNQQFKHEILANTGPHFPAEIIKMVTVSEWTGNQHLHQFISSILGHVIP